MTTKTLFIDKKLPDKSRAVVEFLLRASIEAIGADGTSVMLLSADGGTLAMVGMAARRGGLASNIGISVKRGERVCGRAVQTGETYIINGDVQKNPAFASLKKYQEIKSGMSSPLKAGNKILGVLNLKRIEMDEPLSADEARIAGGLAAIAAEILA